MVGHRNYLLFVSFIILGLHGRIHGHVGGIRNAGPYGIRYLSVSY